MKSVRMNTSAARIMTMVLALLFAICPLALAVQSDMPFNGTIAFHKITLTIPKIYIRDSTQSTADFWVFERGFYSQYIMLSRKDVQKDADEALDLYAGYLTEQGARSQRDTFLQLEAVRSEAVQEDGLWQEVLLEDILGYIFGR